MYDIFFRAIETHAGCITRVYNADRDYWILWTDSGPQIHTEYPLRNAFGY